LLGVEIAGERLTCLLYADDIALLAYSPVMLQRMLNVVSEYARHWRFDFNPAKSHVVVQAGAAQTREAREQQWRLGGARIVTVDEYKYLGMELGKRRGTYTTFCARVISTARRRASRLLYFPARPPRNGSVLDLCHT
jgi:hypothetical protein